MHQNNVPDHLAVVSAAASGRLRVGRRGPGLVNGGLEAPDVLHGQVVALPGTRLHILVQGSEDLRIEDLKSPYPVHHPLELLERQYGCE